MGRATPGAVALSQRKAACGGSTGLSTMPFESAARPDARRQSGNAKSSCPSSRARQRKQAFPSAKVELAVAALRIRKDAVQLRISHRPRMAAYPKT